jgi:hypothetical protein
MYACRCRRVILPTGITFARGATAGAGSAGDFPRFEPLQRHAGTQRPRLQDNLPRRHSAALIVADSAPRDAEFVGKFGLIESRNFARFTQTIGQVELRNHKFWLDAHVCMLTQ